jgi:hypothetical protein
VECISNRTLYISIRGWWSNTVVLNVYTPAEDKSDDTKDSFYEDLEGIQIQLVSKGLEELTMTLTIIIAKVRERDCQ